MEIVSFENYRKILLIITFTFIFMAMSFAGIYVLREFLIDEKLEYFLLFSIELIFAGLVLFFLIKVLKNFNEINYLKIHDTQFEYLRIPNQTFASRSAIWDRIMAIYFTPEYNTKMFYNVINIKVNPYNQIEMLIDDGTIWVLPLHLTESKTKEALWKLNSKLDSYRKKKR